MRLAFMRNGFKFPIVAAWGDTITVKNVNEPLQGHLALTGKNRWTSLPANPKYVLVIHCKPSGIQCPRMAIDLLRAKSNTVVELARAINRPSHVVHQHLAVVPAQHLPQSLPLHTFSMTVDISCLAHFTTGLQRNASSVDNKKQLITRS